MLVNEKENVGEESSEEIQENIQPTEEAKSIVTDKRFSDLTDEDIAGMSEEDSIPYAKRQGWKSPDSFNGDPSKAKSAKDYLHDTYNEAPVMKKNLKKQADEIESLRELVSKTTKQFTDMSKKQQERHKKELEKSLQQSEERLNTAKEDFDIDKVEKEKENVIDFKNELSSIENEAQASVNFEKDQEERKSKEFLDWTYTPEAMELKTADYAKYLGFERLVGQIYSSNKNATVRDIITQAKKEAYGAKKAPHIEGAKANTPAKAISNVSPQDREIIKRYVDIEVANERKKGVSEKDVSEFRKKRTQEYEEFYKET